MLKTPTARNIAITLPVLSVFFLLAHWYLPVHSAGSDAHIESLIDKLASKNSPPDFPPHLMLNDFLKDPGEWKREHQQTVSAAYYELKSMGKSAFPYLIKHMSDERYSHERSWSIFVSHTVGDACRFIIESQVCPAGMGYKSRESPKGMIMGHEVHFESYVKSKYGSYAAWWRNNRSKSILEMRVAFSEWRIGKEKRIGFVDEKQQKRMQKSFERMRVEAAKPPQKMALPAPDWYSVDAIELEIILFKERILEK